jgi:cation diffusion facilitator CzcD-associated flavoprotein CzcO
MEANRMPRVTGEGDQDEGVLGDEGIDAADRPEVIGIVGAGPAGLVTAATLRAAGLPFEVLERHSDIGGIWDLDNPGSPMYTTAHAVSSKAASAFDGFPFPADYPDYPSHSQVLAYLRAYAEEHELREHIRFGEAVRRARRLPGGGWEARTASGTERRYRALVLASGCFWEPNRPAYPGTFTGDSYHAKYYRSPGQLRGKRVLVIGGGNSGVDIACDAAVHAASVTLSVRRGYHFVPKHVLGVPADTLAQRRPHLTPRMEQAVLGMMLRWMVGDLTRFGLPKPDHKVLSSHPIMNTQLLHHLAHGAVRVRPDVTEFDGGTARFADDTKGEFDLVIYATGYRPAYPYLDADDLSWRGGRPQLFLNAFHPRYDDLFAVGLFETDSGAYPIMNLQARLIARYLLEQRERPEQAAALRKLAKTDPELRGGRRYLDTPRHALYVQSRAYRTYGRKLLKRMERGRLPVG